MSKIDELIAKLCPNGVEYKKLGEVGEFIRGSGLQKKDITDFDNGFGAIHYGQIYTYYSIHTNKTKSFVSSAHSKNLKKAKSGNLVIATTSENDTDVCKAVAWLGKEDIAVSSDACIYRHSLEPKYVAYFFQSEQFQLQKLGNITGTKVRRVSPSCMAKFLIPVPPLEIQREIVKVLDTFTKLEAELEAELEARQRQYHYYRDQLLNFEGWDDVQWMTLGEVCDMKAGQHITASNVSGEQNKKYPFPCFGGNGIRGYVQKYSNTGPNLIIGRQGALCGNVQRIKEKFYATEHAVVVKISNIINIDWFFHILINMNLNQYASKSAQPGLAVGNLKQLSIPIPSLEEQTRVAGILDKFDALVNDLSSGLPAEIAARRKQYEYYRDRLLTFKEA